MSKGSNRRPRQVDDKTMTDNWERIFKKPKQDQPIPKDELKELMKHASNA